jgi:arylsulfatase A-like enzyme
MDVWPTLSEGQSSPRKEVVYDIEPFRAALRQGDWKLIWQATLPSKVELFNLAQDPGEQVNLADENPQKVAELKQQIEAQAREAVSPLILSGAIGAVKSALFGSVLLPNEEKALEVEP